MGKITEVYYQEVDPDVMDVYTAGEFYYYQNLLGMNVIYQDEYERSEINNIRVRNMIIGEAINRGDLITSINNEILLAISSIKDKAIVLA